MISKIVLSCLLLTLFCNGNVEAIKKGNLCCGGKVNQIHTAFNSDGSINLEAIKEYSAYLNKTLACDQRCLWIFPVAGENAEVNPDESKQIINEWVKQNNKNNYGFRFLVDASFLFVRDACAFVKYAESLKVAAVVYKRIFDATGASTVAEAVADLNSVAQCAPNTPFYTIYDPYFAPQDCYYNYGQEIGKSYNEIDNYWGFFGTNELISLSRVYVDYSQTMDRFTLFYYNIWASNRIETDAHSTSLGIIFQKFVDRIDDATTVEDGLKAQKALNDRCRTLCDVLLPEPDCGRLPCPLLIEKYALKAVTGIDFGLPRKPLYDPAVCKRNLTQVEASVRQYLVKAGVTLAKA